tara:strand:+ start:190 stop:1200 length:1011 start_codon:yes stop_codon:yes gene_type:complete
MHLGAELLQIFTWLADWLVYDLMGLTAASKTGDALHFFVEDVSKIFVLLVFMIYAISLIRASLNVERVRDFLAHHHPGAGLLMGSAFGAVTPFCSCSSIPVFLGFTSAGIPVGVTMAFLLTSPLINEVAVLLLLSLLGWKFTVLYIVVGMAVGIVGGLILHLLKAERWLQPFAAKAYQRAQSQSLSANPVPQEKMTMAERHEFAKTETKDIFGRVWKWVIIGVGLGAALHGYVPEEWVTDYLGQGQWWSVPAAVLAGIPLYSNATGVIPVIESLITKGLPVGTTLAFCMSTVAASFPEFILLKQVMRLKLLAIIFAMLLCAFTLVGWIFNLLTPYL